MNMYAQLRISCNNEMMSRRLDKSALILDTF